ncbi:hypothetical protein Misp03_74400 [Microbispora sp. NBRC 16548]|nr:hypothetical protein Misp03_74400 [Microbispora sp. NBRC 16548]
MHEDLTAVVAGEEAETLVGVVPLDLATRHRGDLVQTVVKVMDVGYAHRQAPWTHPEAIEASHDQIGVDLPSRRRANARNPCRTGAPAAG